jgi:DNA polymerase III subunit delta
MTVVELEKELKENKLNSIYLIFGEETFLLESSLKKIKKIFGEILPGINYIQIDDTNIEELIPDIQTPAFGYEKKLIIVKKSGIFRKEGRKQTNKIKELKQKVYKYFENNIQEIKDGNVVVFIEDDAENNDLYKLINKEGIVCNFEKQTQAQIIKRLKAIFSAYKVNIDEQTLKYLIDSCGNGMQELINESRKLIEYAGENGKIEKDDIDLLCIKEVNAVIFTLTDSLGKKDIKTALNTLKNLIYNKEPIQKILVTLYNHFKKLYFTKLALNKNKDIAEALNLKANQMFLVNKYKTQASYFETSDLKSILNELILLDKNSKIGQIDLNIGLEAILAKYCS